MARENTMEAETERLRAAMRLALEWLSNESLGAHADFPASGDAAEAKIEQAIDALRRGLGLQPFYADSDLLKKLPGHWQELAKLAGVHSERATFST